MGEEGYSWDWVNHSQNFVKPGQPDVHTNGIEGKFLLYLKKIMTETNFSDCFIVIIISLDFVSMCKKLVLILK